jgi:hypothetical protein
MSILTAIVTALAALLFLTAARVKFLEKEHSMQTRDALGIQPHAYRLIGVCEVAGAAGALVGLAIRPLGIAALSGLVVVAIAACVTQVKLRHTAKEAVPAVLALALSVAALALQATT